MLRLVATFVLLHATAACPTCTLRGLGRDSCYKLEVVTTDWYAAEKQCVNIGGHLTSVGSGFENSFLRQISANLSANTLWIGGSAYGPYEFQWNWTDGSEWTYQRWAHGHPTGIWDEAKCLSFDVLKGNWNNENCSEKKPSVCLIEDKSDNALCADEWIYNPKNGICYGAEVDEARPTDNWLDAQELCQYVNGHLVAIHDRAANFDLLRLARDNDIIHSGGYLVIGLFYNTNTSKWTWTDGSAVDYVNWAPGFPTSSSKTDWAGRPYYTYMSTRGGTAGQWANFGLDVNTWGGVLCQRPPGAE